MLRWQVYADLEESNLFLIQVCQESEEQLEDIKGQYRETQERMDTEVTGLQVLLHTPPECQLSRPNPGCKAGQGWQPRATVVSESCNWVAAIGEVLSS